MVIFLILEGILVIFRFQGYFSHFLASGVFQLFFRFRVYIGYFFRFRGYFGNFYFLGIFWLFFKFRGILVIFRFREYFDYFLGIGGESSNLC